RRQRRRARPQRRCGRTPCPSESPGRRCPDLLLDAVVAPRGRRRDISLSDVSLDRLALALRWRAPTPAASGHDADDLALGDRVLGRLANMAYRAVAGRDLDPVHGTVLSAPESPPRPDLALQAEGDEARRQELVLALDAETAPMLPGAAGVLAQLIAEDPDGAETRLHDLHGIVARGGSAEDDHGRLAVEAGPSARSAGIE